MFTDIEADKVRDRCGGYGAMISPDWKGRIKDVDNNFVGFESMQLYIRASCPFCSRSLGVENTELSFSTYDEFDHFITNKTRVQAAFQRVKEIVLARYKGVEDA